MGLGTWIVGRFVVLYRMLRRVLGLHTGGSHGEIGLHHTAGSKEQIYGRVRRQLLYLSSSIIHIQKSFNHYGQPL